MVNFFLNKKKTVNITGIVILTGGQSNAALITVLPTGINNIYIVSFAGNIDNVDIPNVIPLSAGNAIDPITLGFIQQIRLITSVPLYFARVAVWGCPIVYNEANWISAPYQTFNVHCLDGNLYGHLGYDKWKYLNKTTTTSVFKKITDYINILPTAFLWTHGETDASLLNMNYAYDCNDMITILRQQYNSNLLFLFSKNQDYIQYGGTIHTQFVQLQEYLQNLNPSKNRLIDTSGLVDRGDLIHYDMPSAIELGKRYAIQYINMINLQ